MSSFISRLRVGAVAAAAAMLVVPTSGQCTYDYTDPNTNKVWSYDLSPLTDADTYTVPFDQSFNSTTIASEFSLNFCANAPQECYPSGYSADATSGVVVQTWGTEPTCTKTTSGQAYCEQGLGTNPAHCCTKPCEVMTTNPTPEIFKPYDTDKVGQGTGDGITLTFQPLTDPNSDKSICATGTTTFLVSFTILCDTSIDWKDGLVNNYDGCRYEFLMYSKYACAKAATASTTTAKASTTTGPIVEDTGMSPGSVFLLLLFIAAVLYFGVGTVVLRFMNGSWQIPNRAMWVAFGGLITDGFRFIVRGCKKAPPSAYVDSSPSATTTGDYVEASGNEFGTSNNGQANDEPYDDL